jgi:hypothetical protein
MGRSIYKSGTVVSGDYMGNPVYQLGDFFEILSNDENGKIIVDSWIPTKYTVLRRISKGTVEKFELLSSTEQKADPGAVAGGWLLFGPLGGILGAVGSQSSTHDVAVYFVDGKKCMIRFESSKALQEFNKILYKF